MDAARAIAAAHALPIVRLRDALRAFWPVLAANAVWTAIPSLDPTRGFVDPYAGDTTSVQGTGTVEGGGDGLALAFAGLAILLYLSLLISRGAVAWHRSLIRGEPVPVTPLRPNAVAWRYFGWGLVIGLVASLIAAIASGLVAWIAVASFGAAEPSTVPRPGPVGLTPFSVLVCLAIAVTVGAAFALLAGLWLRLPALSIDGTPPKPDARARWILFGTTAPWVFVTTVVTLPFPPVPPVGVQALLFVVNVYVAVLAVTALSLMFRSADGTL